MTLLNISTSHPNQPDHSAKSSSSDTPVVIIPSYAHWYQKGDHVDDIERRALPDLLSPDSPSATIAVYTSCRDFMVEASRSRPQEYLTVAYCRRMLNADIGMIYRVHAFLEQWGLINYHVNVTLPGNGALQGVVQVHSKGRPVPENLKVDAKSGKLCGVCKAACPKGFYSLIKQPQLAILCDGCFAERRLFDNTASTDYQHQDTPASIVEKSSNGNGGVAWSEEDELRLLEAVEEHSNDWHKISQLVGRPKEVCLLHFLQLDTTCGTTSTTSSSSSDDTHGDVTSTQVSPFAHLDNPVIGTIAFLASLVHPKVAAAAAKAAITALSHDHTRNEAAAVTAFSMAAAKANELAGEEERVIQQLRDAIVLTQMKKVQLKLAYLESLEKNVLEEKAELEKQRMVLFLERVNLKKAIMGMEGKFVKRPDDDSTMEPCHGEDIHMHVISDNTDKV